MLELLTNKELIAAFIAAGGALGATYAAYKGRREALNRSKDSGQTEDVIGKLEIVEETSQEVLPKITELAEAIRILNSQIDSQVISEIRDLERKIDVIQVDLAIVKDRLRKYE